MFTGLGTDGTDGTDFQRVEEVSLFISPLTTFDLPQSNRVNGCPETSGVKAQSKLVKAGQSWSNQKNERPAALAAFPYSGSFDISVDYCPFVLQIIHPQSEPRSG
jgi:hypothetical protein